MRYPEQARLQHHAGSAWEVVRSLPDGDYRIRCVTGTRRTGWVGGEPVGEVRDVHADYLHGDGWTRLQGSEARERQRRMDVTNPPVIEQD